MIKKNLVVLGVVDMRQLLLKEINFFFGMGNSESVLGSCKVLTTYSHYCLKTENYIPFEQELAIYLHLINYLSII